jgi:hypothetical protein
MMTKASERRRHHRIGLEAQVLVTDGTVVHTGSLCDIALRGLLVRFESGWSPTMNALHPLSIWFGASTSISLEGRVMHSDAGRAGIRIERIELFDAARLRRLVELNLGEPALLDRELMALVEADSRSA